MNEIVRVFRDGEVAQVFLNRPRAFNAFDLDMIQLFSGSMITLAGDNAGILHSGFLSAK